jgi:diadenosine tetraphosphate (Ap4A) HIT family hydrolase
MLFAERPLYLHLHMHVVPRMPWFGDDDRATAAFRFLDVPEHAQVPPEERERLAGEIGQAMREILGEPDTDPAAPLS